MYCIYQEYGGVDMHSWMYMTYVLTMYGTYVLTMYVCVYVHTHIHCTCNMHGVYVCVCVCVCGVHRSNSCNMAMKALSDMYA